VDGLVVGLGSLVWWLVAVETGGQAWRGEKRARGDSPDDPRDRGIMKSKMN